MRLHLIEREFLKHLKLDLENACCWLEDFMQYEEDFKGGEKIKKAIAQFETSMNKIDVTLNENSKEVHL